MYRYIIKRLLILIPVIIGVTVLIFTIMFFTPGDAAVMILGPSASSKQLEEKREQLGINRPYLTQLLDYMDKAYLHFDFGKSYITNASISKEISSRFPRTLMLAVIVMIMRALMGTPLGITAATHQNHPRDRISMILALIGCSVPSFWLALMLILVFSLKLRWLPSYGFGSWKYYILPCIAASVTSIGQQARQTRSSMLEVIRADYVTTARAKGLSENSILYKHILPNALIPIVTVLGTGFGFSLAGTLIIENVFTISGIGLYLTNGVTYRDAPVVTGCVVFLCVCMSIVMLMIDLIYAFIDPRIKAQYENQNRRPRWMKNKKETTNA